AGDGEHYTVHHAETQAQGKRGQECGGSTAGAQVPRVQLYGWSRRQAHHCAQISGAVQAPNPGDHAKGQGRQHQDDNGRAGLVYARLARLFRLLRNAQGADSPHPLGPVATPGRSLATVENTTSSSRGSSRTWGLAACGKQNCRQRPSPLAPRPVQSPLNGAFLCILQITRTSVPVRG